MSEKRIAVIGYGAIGRELIAALIGSAEPGYRAAVLLRPGSASLAALPDTVVGCTSEAELADFGPDLVIEAAGHGAVCTIVPDCLKRGWPVLISSIGALHDDGLKTQLVGLVRAHGGRLVLASGALGALDYVRAARDADGLMVTYASRKPPSAWASELRALGHDPATLSETVELFRGNASEAAALYPQNLNVAAALALAGPGFTRTDVRVVCDPDATGNTHQVHVDSALGSMRIEIGNAPSPANPKSSWIVAHALKAATDQFFAPIQML